MIHLFIGYTILFKYFNSEQFDYPWYVHQVMKDNVIVSLSPQNAIWRLNKCTDYQLEYFAFCSSYHQNRGSSYYNFPPVDI